MQENQDRPQIFELVSLLFENLGVESNQPTTGRHAAHHEQNSFSCFKSRFQSFIDQIPSYLSSGCKDGFFPHFFLGVFASLLDTRLNAEKIHVEDIYFCFDSAKTLKVVTNIKEETHVFIFTEEADKQHSDTACMHKFEFTKGELDQINAMGQNKKPSQKNIKINLIKINKPKGEKITVEVENKKINKNETTPRGKFIKIKERLIDKDSKGNRIYLEDWISKLSEQESIQVNEYLEKILYYTKNVHSELRLDSMYYTITNNRKIGVYGYLAREANHHGFVAGIFDNFRYRYNAKIYLEQFAGRGRTDIALLVRGPDRLIKAIPIIIELKADKFNLKTNKLVQPGLSCDVALTQSKGYAISHQPNKVRFLSISNHIICVGLNLDQVKSFKTYTLDRNQHQPPVNPLMEKLLTDLNDWNEQRITIDELKDRINNSISHEYCTFPPTSEKTQQFYFSQFLLLGQSILLNEHLGTKLKKYIFIHRVDTSIKKIKVLSREAKKLEQAIFTEEKTPREEYKDNIIITIAFVPDDSSKPVFLIHAIESDLTDHIAIREIPQIEFEKIHLDDRKLIEFTFKTNTYKTELKDFFKINSIEKHNSLDDYYASNSHTHASFNGEFHPFKDSDYPSVLKGTFNDAIASQKNHLNEQPVFSSDAYKKLFLNFSEGVFPFKILVEKESDIQAIIHGTFNYFSDLKLRDTPENIELVLTEFQTGAGSRIDMMIQGIGNSLQGLKEYMPVGVELKYGLLNDKQTAELRDQMERYNHGAAIKAITDSSKVVIIGVDFDNTSTEPNALFILVEPQNCGIVTHSSIVIGEQHPVRIFPVSNLNQAMAGMTDLTPISGTINVILPTRQPRQDVGLPNP